MNKNIDIESLVKNIAQDGGKSTGNVASTLSSVASSIELFRMIESNVRIPFSDLDKVYHSETMHEMQVNADLYNVDLCDPYVLLFLAEQTTYHHAFWPHTAKRFTSFKNILRKDKDVRKSLQDGKFICMAKDRLSAIETEWTWRPVVRTPGRKQEIKNWKQVIDIVEKAMQQNEA